MSFKEIAGNQQVKQILRLSLKKGRLPNSLLLAGPAGCGKLKTALTVAKALNCLEMTDDSCDRCDSCLRLDRGHHPNVQLVRRQKNREQIVKEQIEEVNYLAGLRPWNQGRTVFIIDEADRMNETVANSLLKTLEEPRSFVYFILVTENLQLILPTIRSRCQVLRFNPLSQEDIEKALKEKGLPADRAALMASAADGNLEAIQDLSWDEFLASRNRAWLTFRQLIEAWEPEDFLNLVASRSRKDSLFGFQEILKLFSVFFRDLLVVYRNKSEYLLNLDLKEELVEIARLITEEGAAEGVRTVEAYLRRLKKNPNLSIMGNELVIFFRELRHV